jgi:thymidylate kinase
LVLQQDVAPEAWIRSLNNYATSGIQPDKTIFLDVSKETSVKRLNKRGGLNHYDVAFSEKAEMLRKRYYQLISYDPHRWLIVPESTMSPQEVHQQIVRRLEFDMSLNTTFDELYV